jgi:hypothetical protein
MGGDIDRDTGRIDITYLIYGTDQDGNRRYIATDVFEMKKGFRVWARSNGCRDIKIVYRDEATAMRSTIQNRYENHNYDLNTNMSLSEGAKANNYQLALDSSLDLVDE